jgi:hypothetical protein
VDTRLAENAAKMPNGDGVLAWMNGIRKGKIDRLEKESARLAAMMKQIDELPAGAAGEAETAKFFRSLSADDFGMLRKRIQYSEGLLPRSLRKSVLADFRAYDYLKDDWKIADEFTRAFQRWAVRELPDIIIGADGTLWKAEDFKRQADGTYVATRIEKDEQGRPIHSSRMEYKIDPEDFYQRPQDYLEGTFLLQKKSDEGVRWKRGEPGVAASTTQK